MNGKIIAVCGGNGVGKSTICTNLATVLSEDKIVILFAPRTDYPSIQSFFDMNIAENKSLKKLYDDMSIEESVDIKEYLVQYKNSNIFILSAPDTTNVLTFADNKILPEQNKCINMLIALQRMCDYLIIDCDTNVTNHVSAWGLNYADIVINVMKPTQQGLRIANAYQGYFSEIWRGKVVNVVNADKNYIGTSDFEKALDVPVKFDIELPYDEQVELSENTGVPIINEYHKVKLFGGNYKKAFMELVDIILTDNEE